MEDVELVKMFNPTLIRRKAILFFLIVVINELKCIVSDIELDTCARRRRRVEVSKLEMNQPLGSSYLTAHLEIDSFRPNPRYCNTQYTQRKNREILDKEGCSFWQSFGLEHFVQRLFQPYNTCWAVVSQGRQVREGLHRLRSLANQGLESP